VPQQFDRPIDRGCRERPIRLPVHNARQLEVGDEVFDVGGLDVLKCANAEPIEQRFEPVIDRAGVRQAFGLDVPLLVDLRELAERQRRDVARRFDAALVECAVANRALQIVERRVRCRLVVDLAICPLCKADAYAAKATPPRVFASVASTAAVLAKLVRDTPPTVDVRSTVRGICAARACCSSQPSIHSDCSRMVRRPPTRACRSSRRSHAV